MTVCDDDQTKFGAWGLNGTDDVQVWGTEERGLRLKFCHLRTTLDSACDTAGVVALNLQLLLSRFYPHLKQKVSHLSEKTAKKGPKSIQQYRKRTFIRSLLVFSVSISHFAI